MLAHIHGVLSSNRTPGQHRLSMVALIALSLIAAAAGAYYFGEPVVVVGAGIVALHFLVPVIFIAFVRLRSTNRRMNRRMDPSKASQTGIILSGAGYDLLVRSLTFGREKELRERMLEYARLQPGEAVLDAGCGTGTLAIYAKQRVGSGGRVVGIDASPRMIKRAEAKANRAGVDVKFVTASAHALPFDDHRFDVVMGTLLLHHLPKQIRGAFVHEARRVLNANGRLLLIDFDRHQHETGFGLHRHGNVDERAVRELLEECGFVISEVGDLGKAGLIYFVAKQTHSAGAGET